MPVDKKPIEITGYPGSAHYPVVVQLRDGVVVLLFREVSTRSLMGRTIRWVHGEVVLSPVQVLTKQNASNLSVISTSEDSLLVVFRDGDRIGYPRLLFMKEDGGVLYPQEPITLLDLDLGLSRFCREISVCKLNNSLGVIGFVGAEQRDLYLSLFSFSNFSFEIIRQGVYCSQKIRQFEMGSSSGDLVILSRDLKSRPFIHTLDPLTLEIQTGGKISEDPTCDLSLSKQYDKPLAYSITYNNGNFNFGIVDSLLSDGDLNFTRKLRGVNTQILVDDYGQNVITMTDQGLGGSGKNVVFWNKISWVENLEVGPSNWKPQKNRSLCNLGDRGNGTFYKIIALLKPSQQNRILLWIEPVIESLYTKHYLLDEEYIPLEDEGGKILLEEYIE